MDSIDERRARQDDILECVRSHLDQANGSGQNRDRPFVTLTYAQSIDGCIARFGGETLQLSNPTARKLTHQVRALHDAILVGINTVIQDNPRLNVRLVNGQSPQPVIVDSHLRFPLEANLLKDPCVRPIIAASHTACEVRERSLSSAGARVIRVTRQDDGLLDLSQLLRQLKQLGLHSVMIEGGASIITSVLTSHFADQFLLTISPRFVGGLRTVKSQDRGDHENMPRLRNLHFQWLAENLILRGDLDQTNGATSDPLVSQPADPSQARNVRDAAKQRKGGNGR